MVTSNHFTGCRIISFSRQSSSSANLTERKFRSFNIQQILRCTSHSISSIGKSIMSRSIIKTFVFVHYVDCRCIHLSFLRLFFFFVIAYIYNGIFFFQFFSITKIKVLLCIYASLRERYFSPVPSSLYLQTQWRMFFCFLSSSISKMEGLVRIVRVRVSIGTTIPGVSM